MLRMSSNRIVPSVLKRAFGSFPGSLRVVSSRLPRVLPQQPVALYHHSEILLAARKKKASTDADGLLADTKLKQSADAEPEKVSALKKKFLEILEDEWAEAEADTLEVVASQLREAAFFDVPKAARGKKSVDFDDSNEEATEAIDADGNATKPTKLTYIGGLPLAPARSESSQQWPTRSIKLQNGTEMKVPLEFVFQIDLADVPRTKFASRDQAVFPEVGLMQFFATNLTFLSEGNRTTFSSSPLAAEHRRSPWLCAVRFAEPGSDTPQLPPKDGPIECRIYDRVEFSPRVGLSARPKVLVAENLPVEEGGAPQFEMESVIDILESKHSTTAHQFLGMPQSLSGNVEVDAAAAVSAESAAPDPKDALIWRNLLQVSADPETGVFDSEDNIRMWFMIREDDLRAHKWDAVIGIHQK